MKNNIYLACSLTHVPEDEFQEYLSFIYGFSGLIADEGYVVESVLTARNNHKESSIKTPADCYYGYKEIIEKSNLVIAEATYPSTGMGIELQIASDKKIPIIILNKKSRKKRKPIAFKIEQETIEFLLGSGGISAMLEGLPNVCSIVNYECQEDAYIKIKSIIKNYIPA